MKRKRKDEGISEILGTVLLLGISIALFSVLYLMLQNVLVAEHTPVADLVSYIDGDTVFIKHHGGNSLPGSIVITVSVGGTDHIIDFDDSFDRNNNGYWDIGEQVYFSSPQMEEPVAVVVSVVDVASNKLLYLGRLKDGAIDEQDNGDISINLNTSVDLIKPYEQTDPPLTITATGDSSLDNINLWYRWSNFNFTQDDDNNEQWTIVALTNESGNWSIPENVNKIDVLVVGGGGGSGRGTHAAAFNAGAGGAGGLVFIQNVTRLGDVDILPGNLIYYSVGTGGEGSEETGSTGNTGDNTVFGDIKALGGGGGGSSNNVNGLAGGSGGGGGRSAGTTGTSGSGLQPFQDVWYRPYGFGNDGGSGNDGGGGGGSGGEGSGTTGGAGMNMSDYFGTVHGDNGIFSKGGDPNSGITSIPPNSGYGGNARSKTDSGNGIAGADGIILIRYQKITEIDYSDWMMWDNDSNPDEEYPWSWNFTFPNGTGYYEFFSIGEYNGQFEDMKPEAEAMCRYVNDEE